MKGNKYQCIDQNVITFSIIEDFYENWIEFFL